MVALIVVTNAVPIGALWGLPAVGTTCDEEPARLVSLKLFAVRPTDDPATENMPAAEPAVNVVAVAMPLPFVVVEVVSVPFRKVPLAPLPGAVNVTVVPGVSTGFPCESSTVALKVVANAVPTGVL
jgi:hypothetical protein